MGILRARETFHTGNHRTIRRGQLVPDTDPVVAGRRHLFEEITSIEQATAAPGEKRDVRKPKVAK